MLTAVGDAMVDYPLSPRHSRLILAAAELLQQGRFKDKKLLVYAIGLSATLSAESPFLASTGAPAGSNQDEPAGAFEKVCMHCYTLCVATICPPHQLLLLRWSAVNLYFFEGI